MARAGGTSDHCAVAAARPGWSNGTAPEVAEVNDDENRDGIGE
jgi:hypothetical protein